MKALFIIFFCFKAHAQLNFGQDTALLFELVTTTASQLNELEKLVTNAEKYTKKMQEYNELLQDEYFRAERVLYLAEQLTTKRDIENLGDLNNAIRELKYSLTDLKELMREYGIIKEEEQKTKVQVKIEKRMNERQGKQAIAQVNKSIQAKTVGRASQLTAQNTALLLESQVGMHNTQLDILDKVATTNRLLAEGMEEKRMEQIQREKTYGQHSNLKGGKL
ncbi:MAG: hypothetical protein A2X86_12980 [Bdellovibrionales bacterium GWA2_49_15]|nr:MAG: hypothetical protein A2X86_12980 [Bdellovibrionales bacterium GWA2_49_15]HAZ13899.1 hypothetical protein [Bdellovibrionales bacterium]